jgi:hypothetical protein
MRKRKAVVREHFDRDIAFKFRGRYLDFHEVFEPVSAKKHSRKKLKEVVMKKKEKYIPPKDHPWRRYNPKLHHNCYLEKI